MATPFRTALSTRDTRAIVQHSSEESVAFADAEPDSEPTLYAVVAGESSTAEDDATLVTYLASLGAKPNALGPSGHPPLHLAITRELESVAMALLDSGALARWANSHTSILHAAVDAGMTSVARRLLSRGVPADILSDRVATPLCEASRAGNCDMVRLLLEHDANASSPVPAGERAGYTPLRCAIAADNPKVVTLLMGHGAQLNDDDLRLVAEKIIRGGNAHTLLHPLTSTSGELPQTDDRLSTQCLAVVWDKLSDDNRGTLQHIVRHEAMRAAIVAGDAKQLKVALAGCDVQNTRFEMGPLLAFAATFPKRREVLELLLDHGVDIDSQHWPTDNFEEEGTALFIAVRYGNPENVRTLLQRGADPNLEPLFEGQGHADTPLSVAIETDQPKIVRMLRAEGATDPNVDWETAKLSNEMRAALSASTSEA